MILDDAPGSQPQVKRLKTENQTVASANELPEVQKALQQEPSRNFVESATTNKLDNPQLTTPAFISAQQPVQSGGSELQQLEQVAQTYTAKQSTYVAEIDALESYQSEKVDALFKAEHELFNNIHALENSLQPYMTDASQQANHLKKTIDKINNQKKNIEDGLHGLEMGLQQQRQVNINLQTEFSHHAICRFSKLTPMLETLHQQVLEKLNKTASLNISGGDTELSEMLANRLSVILGHLLRNALSHGIESPSLRLNNGKHAQGAINIALKEKTSQLLLIVEDDGQGVDINALHSKAVQGGFIERTEKRLEKIVETIFCSGLSTSQALDQISGRGIGLDVVRHEVEQLGGKITVFNETGAGMRFEIEIPYVPASMQLLRISQAGFEYALAQQHVLQVLNYDQASIQLQNAEPQLCYQGEYYRYYTLAYLLFNQAIQLPTATDKLLLLDVDGQRCVLLANAVIDVVQAPLQHASVVAEQALFIWAFALVHAHQTVPVVNTSYIVNMHQPIPLIRVFNQLEPSAQNESNILVAQLLTTSVNMQPDTAVAQQHLQQAQARASATAIATAAQAASAVPTQQVSAAELKPPDTSRSHAAADQVHGAVTLIIEDEDELEQSLAMPDRRQQEMATESLSKQQQPICVLVVNNALDDTQGFTDYLAKQKLQHWRVEQSDKPLEFLQQYAAQVDVMLLSSVGKEHVNLDILTQIRKHLQHRRLPIVVATTLSSDIFKQRAYILGANYVLQKPYNYFQLKEVVELVAGQVAVVEDIHGTS